MKDIQTLIDRLKSAPTPSGLLDEAIAAAIGWDPEEPLPRWTASIEAAISLVPDETELLIYRKDGVCIASIGDSGRSAATTLAVAMCMAVLRHIAALEAAQDAAAAPAQDGG